MGSGKSVSGSGERALGAGGVPISPLLAIFFMFTGENSLVCCFFPDGEIWASGTMVEAETASVGAGAVPAKTVASGVDSLFRETGRLVAVASYLASSFILSVFNFSVPVFCFC